MDVLKTKRLHHVPRDVGVGDKAVVLFGVAAPLAQASANGVGADHEVVVAQLLGQPVKVAACAGEAMPRNDGGL